EHSDAADQLVHDVLLARHHLRQVDADLPDVDAMSPEVVLRGEKSLGGIEKRFAWDAADIQARSAEIFALDARDFHAQLRRANRRDIPARPGADHDQVELGFAHKEGIVCSLFYPERTAPATSIAFSVSGRETSRCVTARTRALILLNR